MYLPKNNVEEIVAFPSPFNPLAGELTIRTNKPAIDAHVYDQFGNLIRTLHKSDTDEVFKWDGRRSDRLGSFVSNGGYTIVLDIPERTYYKVFVLKKNE